MNVSQFEPTSLGTMRMKRKGAKTDRSLIQRMYDLAKNTQRFVDRGRLCHA